MSSSSGPVSFKIDFEPVKHVTVGFQQAYVKTYTDVLVPQSEIVKDFAVIARWAIWVGAMTSASAFLIGGKYHFSAVLNLLIAFATPNIYVGWSLGRLAGKQLAMQLKGL